MLTADFESFQAAVQKVNDSLKELDEWAARCRRSAQERQAYLDRWEPSHAPVDGLCRILKCRAALTNDEIQASQHRPIGTHDRSGSFVCDKCFAAYCEYLSGPSGERGQPRQRGSFYLPNTGAKLDWEKRGG